MNLGRPPGGPVAHAIIGRLADENRTTLDLAIDRPWLRALTPDVDDVLYRMSRAGLAHRIQSGRYVVNVDGKPSRQPRLDALDPLAPAMLQRFTHEWYLSWHSALWHYGLLDQQAARLFVAMTVRKRPAHVGRNEVRIVTVHERKFFGWDSVEEFDQTLHVARVEKAIVDSFDQPHRAAPVPVIANAMRSAWLGGTLDPERLVADTLRFESPVLNRRVGFFMDLFEMPSTDRLALHIGRKSAVPLAPGWQPAAGTTPVNSRWLVYEDPAIVGATLEPR